jgi:hypothetical protein
MVKFVVTESDGSCSYELKDVGYTVSPTDASTCKTSTEIAGHWESKTDGQTATSNEEEGYGIQELSYNKYC